MRDHNSVQFVPCKHICGDMERPFYYLRSLVTSIRPETCCFITPLRIGLIATGYFNMIVAAISLLGTANESFSPTIVKIQEIILEDNANKTAPVIAYATEIAFSVLFLCGMYRKDVVLLRAYLYYCVGAVILSILVYSMVIAAIDVLLQIVIIFNTAFQIYILLLVRCTILVMESSKENRHATVAMSSLTSDDKPTPSKYFVEFEKISSDKIKKPTDLETKSAETDHNCLSLGNKSVDTVIKSENPEDTNGQGSENKSAATEDTSTGTERKPASTEKKPVSTDTSTKLAVIENKSIDSDKESADVDEKLENSNNISTDFENKTPPKEPQSGSKKFIDAEKMFDIENKPTNTETVSVRKKFFGKEKKSVESKKKSNDSKKKSQNVEKAMVEPGTSIENSEMKLGAVDEHPKK